MSSLTQRIRDHLVALRMPRALEVLDQTLRGLEQGEVTAIEAIDSLLVEEYASRENRRVGVALNTSRLIPVKTLESFDFTFQPALDRNRIMTLAQLQFIGRAEAVHLLGPPGTGKSHLACALGVTAVKAGKSVYRATLAELIDALIKAEREGRLTEKIRFYSRTALLIVDEIGYLPISQGGANLFFQLINARYEKGAMILTSNRGFAEWGDIFGDPVVATALLDRLLHHAIVIQIEGASYRMRNHAELVLNMCEPMPLYHHRLLPKNAVVPVKIWRLIDHNYGSSPHELTGHFYFGTSGNFYFGIDTDSVPAESGAPCPDSQAQVRFNGRK